MDINTYCEGTLFQAREALRKRKITARDLTECATDRILKDEDSKACFTHINSEAVAEAEKANPDTLLGGIPFAHKDILSIKNGVPSFAAHPGLRRRTENDAEVLTHIARSGGINLGRLHLAEFAMGASGWNEIWGYLKNPLYPDRVSGGSSSGSAASVARKLVFASIGTDTGGSIRVPSSFCGVVGFKPTNGLVSTKGVFPVSPTLDTVGPLARNVRDCAIMLDAMQSQLCVEKKLSDSFDKSISVGMISQGSLPSESDADAAEALELAIKACAVAGINVTEVKTNLPSDANVLSGIVFLSEAASIHMRHLREKPGLIGPQVRNRLFLGLTYPAALYIRAKAEQVTFKERWQQELPRIILCPSTPSLPPVISSYNGKTTDEIIALNGRLGSYTAFANYLGLPSLSLPIPLSDEKRLGVQIIGRPGEDALVFQMALLLEKELS